MQCRNCGSNLEEGFRYCPRCGAPGSLGWPAAGGPWLRRPAAVAGLALMVIAWLAALQRQLWFSGRPPAGSPPAHSAWLAARPSTPLPNSGPDRPVAGPPGGRILAPRSHQPGAVVRHRAPSEPDRVASRRELPCRSLRLRPRGSRPRPARVDGRPGPHSTPGSGQPPCRQPRAPPRGAPGSRVTSSRRSGPAGPPGRSASPVEPPAAGRGSLVPSPGPRQVTRPPHRRAGDQLFGPGRKHLRATLWGEDLRVHGWGA